MGLKHVQQHDEFGLGWSSAFGSYTLDVISSCCFGIEINAIKDPENVFLKNLQQVFANTRNPKLFLVCKLVRC